ncbi:unnamed protein product, partial [marine sediment metagenome]
TNPGDMKRVHFLGLKNVPVILFGAPLASEKNGFQR